MDSLYEKVGGMVLPVLKGWYLRQSVCESGAWEQFVCETVGPWRQSV